MAYACSSTGWAVAGASGSAVRTRPGRPRRQHCLVALGQSSRRWHRACTSATWIACSSTPSVRAPGIGRVTAEVRNLTSELAWEGKAADRDARPHAMDRESALRAPARGARDQWRPVALRCARHRAGNGLPEAGIRVDTRASYADRVVTIESVALETGPASFIHANGTMTVAEEPSYDVSATWTGFRWPLTGNALLTSPRGSLEARGWTEFDYRVSGDFRPALRSADCRRCDRPLHDRRDCRRRVLVAGPRRPGFASRQARPR